MNEHAAELTVATPAPLRGRRVVTADGFLLGDVDGETATHLRVHTPDGGAPSDHLWIPRAFVRLIEDDELHLSRERADMHDAVLSLSPGEQREFGSLGVTVDIGRHRWLGERDADVGSG